MENGDILRLTTAYGVLKYRVSWLDVIDSSTQDLVLEPGIDRLTLMTCYPFDALTIGGTLRYVVTAIPVI